MKGRMPSTAALLEIGLGVSLLGLLVGLGLLLAGWANGGARRLGRKRQGKPAPGSVPAGRHQHIGAVSPR